MSYQAGYLKYKMKYNELKQFAGGPEQLEAMKKEQQRLIAITEIYNKLYNSYKVYRFRFNNTKPILPLIPLSNTIRKVIISLGCVYTNNYIEDLNNTTSTNRDKIVFSLRRKANLIIESMLLKNDEALSLITSYNEALEKHKVILNSANEIDYNELVEKSKMIGALVTPGQTPYTPIPNPGAIDPLDIIRNDSNIILKLIGDNFETPIKDDNLDNNTNLQINNLFLYCFMNINRSLNSLPLREKLTSWETYDMNNDQNDIKDFIYNTF